MRKTTNSANNSAVLAGYRNSDLVCCKWIFLNFQFVELYPFEVSIPGISVKVLCSYKSCVKIFIYFWVHKVYSNNHVKFIPHSFSFIPVCRLKLTATTAGYAWLFLNVPKSVWMAFVLRLPIVIPYLTVPYTFVLESKHLIFLFSSWKYLILFVLD